MVVLFLCFVYTRLLINTICIWIFFFSTNKFWLMYFTLHQVNCVMSFSKSPDWHDALFLSFFLFVVFFSCCYCCCCCCFRCCQITLNILRFTIHINHSQDEYKSIGIVWLSVLSKMLLLLLLSKVTHHDKHSSHD